MKILNSNHIIKDTGAPHLVGRYPSKLGPVDCYVILDGHRFWTEFRSQAESLLCEFEQVQDSVWHKTHSTLDNTFNVGAVIYFTLNGRAAGFLSAKAVKDRMQNETILFSDAMIMAQLHGIGLCSMAFSILQLLLFDFDSLARKYCLFLSAHIAPFAHFCKSGAHKRVEFNLMSLKQVNHFYGLAATTGGVERAPIDARGVVQGIFREQRSSDTLVWPTEAVAALGLPPDISYSNGDALLGLFEFSGDSRFLSERVNAHLGLEPTEFVRKIRGLAKK